MFKITKLISNFIIYSIQLYVNTKQTLLMNFFKYNINYYIISLLMLNIKTIDFVVYKAADEQYRNSP